MADDSPAGATGGTGAEPAVLQAPPQTVAEPAPAGSTPGSSTGSNMAAADALVDSLAAMFQSPTEKFAAAFDTMTSMFTETKQVCVCVGGGSHAHRT